MEKSTEFLNYEPEVLLTHFNDDNDEDDYVNEENHCELNVTIFLFFTFFKSN